MPGLFEAGGEREVEVCRRKSAPDRDVAEVPDSWLDGQELFIVRGKLWEEKINVITLFTEKWVVFDRYDQWSYWKLLSERECPVRAAGSVSGAPAAVPREYNLEERIALRYMDKKIEERDAKIEEVKASACLLYTSPSPRDATLSRMPSSA